MGTALLALLLTADPPPSLEARLRQVFAEAGPRVVLSDLRTGETRVVLGLVLTPELPLDPLPLEVELLHETAVGAIAALAPEVQAIDLLVAHPGEPLRPPPRRPRAQRPRPILAVVPEPGRFPFGQALQGKTVALSPGHGYIYYDSLMDYGTQRGRVAWAGCGDCRGIVEDFETHEIVVRHLIPLLEGAGARVVLVRERDHAAAGTVVEEGSAGFSVLGGAFTPGSSEGGHGGGYQASLDPGAQVRYRVTAPAGGRQALAAWFVAGTNRHSNVQVSIRGANLELALLLDQQRLGRRWIELAPLDLSAGDALTVEVTAPNAAGALIADALKLGGGAHGTGHPWWQMGALPFLTSLELPADVLSFGDVTIRPRAAEWWGADVYLSLHSNASGSPDSTAAGLASYRYNCGRFPDHSADPPAADCDDPAGSDRLQALVHAAMVDRLRAEWDPAWIDRGPKVANFGELRELDGIPGVLIESAFHDQVRLAAGSDLRMTDNQALHDPRWRRTAAYAIYAGLSEFLAGPQAPLVPLPPVALSLVRTGTGSVRLDFSPVPGARAYRAYLARGGRSFDRGQLIPGPGSELAGLAAEEPVFVRLAALNEAGEGPQSAVVAARPSARRAQLLLIDGFEREDAWIQDQDNRRETLLTHGLALSAAEHAFDSATEAAWLAGQVRIADYAGVVLALGAESTADGVLTPALRGEIEAAAGTAYFASGSEIGWALGSRGDTASRSFLAQVFGAAYAADDAAALEVTAAPGGWLAPALSAPLALDDGDGGALRARSSDVLTATGAASVELSYGPGQAAAVRAGRNLLMGFALDSVLGAQARGEVLAAWAQAAVPLDVIPPVPDGGVVPAPDGGADAGAPPPPDAGQVEAPDAGAPDADPRPPLSRRPGRDPIEGGCGCQATSNAAEALAGPAALLALALLGGSRRPRGRRRGAAD